MNHPFDTFVQAGHDRGCFRARSCFVRGDKARMLCPVHRDCKASLSVQRREHDILFNCFFCGPAGKGKILQALGLRLQDLFDGPRQAMTKPVISVTYPYTDPDGVLLAEKVRMSNKEFWWRRPDLHSKGGWRNGRGAGVGVYRLHDLSDARTIYVTEGEKSCDRLWSLGLRATCGPDGAGTWKQDWSMAIYKAGCRELIIFADNDRPGARHSELVAGITSALEVANPIVLRVVHLPDLADKADVFDYLESGHDANDLLGVVAMTPTWTPDQSDRARLARRRLKTRDRVRRHRARNAANVEEIAVTLAKGAVPECNAANVKACNAFLGNAGFDSCELLAVQSFVVRNAMRTFFKHVAVDCS